MTEYEEQIAALQRVTYQVGSLTRSLDQSTDDAPEPDRSDFLRRYADLLLCLADLTGILTGIDLDQLQRHTDQLAAANDHAQHLHSRLTGEADRADLPLTDPSRPYGLLLIEATRLTEEFRHRRPHHGRRPPPHTHRRRPRLRLADAL